MTGRVARYQLRGLASVAAIAALECPGEPVAALGDGGSGGRRRPRRAASRWEQGRVGAGIGGTGHGAEPQGRGPGHLDAALVAEEGDHDLEPLPLADDLHLHPEAAEGHRAVHVDGDAGNPHRHERGYPLDGPVSSAAGVPPYWALESHGPWVRTVAITESGPSGTNMASTPTS